MPSLGAIVADRLGSSPDEAVVRALDERVVALHARGAAAWPGVVLPAEVFAAELGSRLHAEGIDVDDVERLCTDDLYLAWACLHGAPGAHAAFDRAFQAELQRMFAVLRRRRVEEDDMRQKLLVRLLVGDEAHRPGIASYSGRGRLKKWVRVAAARWQIDLARNKESPEEPMGADEIEALRDPLERDPELVGLKARYRQEFREAFADAVASLDPRERLLLRLHVVDGLSATRIAAAHDVHRATAKRWLAAARTHVLEATRAAMARRLEIDELELDSIMRLISSRLDVSLSRILRTPMAP